MKLIDTLLEVWESVKGDPIIVSALIVGFCGVIMIMVAMISAVVAGF